MRLSSWWALLLIFALPMAAMAESEENGPNAGCGVENWDSVGGTLVFVPDSGALAGLGIEIRDVRTTDVIDEASGLATVFATLDMPGLGIVAYDGIFRAFSGGYVQTLGGLTLATEQGTAAIGDWRIERNDDPSGTRWVVRDMANGLGQVFELMPSGSVHFSRDAKELKWNGLEVLLTDEISRRLGVETTEPIGHLFFRSSITPGSAADDFEVEVAPAPTSRGGIGPDVIVGDIYDDIRYATNATQSSYAFGTESCNIGDEAAIWIANNNQHPVIGQSVYRLADGRFEMLGMGWLKHSFCAIDLDLCDPCNDLWGCERLSIGCSDPYSASLNGSQSGLGPRYQVNATTGFFPYPPANPAYSGGFARRTILLNEDIRPSENPGALYFVEAQYVTPDDAAADNDDNNTSYRRIQFNASLNASFVGSTVRELSAIRAWKTQIPDVELTVVDNDGQIIIGSNATDLGNGTWRYDYMVYNKNSHNSIRSFRVDIPAGVNISDLYFRDVDYHSGELVDGTDWTATQTATAIKWETETLAQNPNANAIRWSTGYTFSFVADTAPAAGTGWCEEFRVDNEFRAFVRGPSAPNNPFLIDLTLTIDDTEVNPGERVVGNAGVTYNGAAGTNVEFRISIVEPGGTIWGGGPIKTKSKFLSPGFSKMDVPIRWRVPNDATPGGYEILIEAERPDNAMESVTAAFNVN